MDNELLFFPFALSFKRPPHYHHEQAEREQCWLSEIGSEFQPTHGAIEYQRTEKTNEQNSET
jgi:hypothetical protein